MTAAELLRGLDKAATAGPWVCRNAAIYADHIRHDAGRETLPRWVAQASKMSDPAHTYAEVFATARLIATTRNLLKPLALFLETAGDYHLPPAVQDALAALNAAAAKEVK